MSADEGPSDSRKLDLSSYLERIRHPVPEGPATLATLRSIHGAHLEAVPFENLDQRLGRPTHLDLESLQEKIVRRRRGGYCFEQNTLFAAVLRELGFNVDTLEARVRPPGATTPLPRTHMVLRVTVDGREWLADVGFGGDGPFLPVPLDGEPIRQGSEAYRIEREGKLFVLRATLSGVWRDLYAFGPEPALPVDFEVAHYFTATHPRSTFRQRLTVQRCTSTDRHCLRARTYERTGATVETRANLSDEEVFEIITNTMGLDVPFEDLRMALQ